MKLRAVLFDLDGTLVDTAPDLCGTIQDMQSDRGVDITALKDMTHLASGGARALLHKGFGIDISHPQFATMRQEFLTRYEVRICRESALYGGIAPLLADLESRGVLWGIVTNKPHYLAHMLVENLSGLSGCSVLVGGDSAEKPKPSPLPCLLAASRLGVTGAQCIMVGDDLRDIQAGKAAGMLTAAVEYGYIASEVHQWQADHVFDSPHALAKWLEQNTH